MERPAANGRQTSLLGPRGTAVLPGKISLMSPSTFGWVDFAESDRRRMAEVVRLFTEPEARDELGLGVIRDALAEEMFPGTSTIQTRARYFLFVPWLYRRLEKKGVSAPEVKKRIRDDEARLIRALAEGGEETGVIGIQAGADLDRFPSEVYWAGLGRLGIRTYAGSIDGYHRNFDVLSRVRHDEDQGGDGSERPNAFGAWDAGLPPEPTGLLQSTTFQLSHEEALYLAAKIHGARDKSVLADLVRARKEPLDASFPWHPQVLGSVRKSLHPLIEHARAFAVLMHGASLFYNWMICQTPPIHDERGKSYAEALENWAEEVRADEELRKWDRSAFWNLVRGTGAPVSAGTRLFVDGWLDIAQSSRATNLSGDDAARALIFRRETALKRGPRSRLLPKNIRARERWSGASGSVRMGYRWNRVQAISNDIALALIEA